MPENNKRSARRLLIAAMGLTAGLAMAPQSQAAQMGYVTDSSGEVWKVSGECLKSLNENPKMMAECGDMMEEKPVEAAQEAKPAPKPAPKLAPAAAKTPDCEGTVNFDFDRSNLKAEMKKILDELATDAKGSNAKVKIVGHTDAIGTEAYNMGLSMRRANSTADYLKGQGVDVTSVTGEGESNPVSSNASDNGRAMNRRAEVTCH